MRFMVIVKASKESESGVLPDQELLGAMMKYNEELVRAGVMLAGEGLHPTSEGVRLKIDGSQRTCVRGPFGATEEQVAGYWLWQCRSFEEALAWAQRCPNPHPGKSEIEVRQVFEVTDFPAATPELVEREQQLRARTAAAAS